MKCPTCSASLSAWSWDETTCKQCGAKLESVNGRKVNFALIVVWALTGKLIIIYVFDSFIGGLMATVAVGTPFALIIRKAAVRYRVVDSNEA